MSFVLIIVVMQIYFLLSCILTNHKDKDIHGDKDR